MSTRNPSGRPGGQRPRRRGRVSPINGSVTREDIRAIYAEAKRLGPVDPPMTADEAIEYIIGAIVDWTPGPRQRAKMRAKATRREAAKRESRADRGRVAQIPTRTAAAA